MTESISGAELEYLATVQISRILSKDCISLRHDASVSEAIDEMTRRDLGAVAVEDDSGNVIGVFTERDVLLRALGPGDEWLARPLSSVMTPDPVTVSEADSVADALHKMKAGHFRHLPVTGEDGRATAMLSIRQIISDVAEHFPKEVQNLPPDPRMESRKLYGG